MVSPSLARRALPQQVQAVGPGTMTRSRGRCSENGLRDGRSRVNGERGDIGSFGGGHFCRQFVLGGAHVQVFEFQRYLVQQARGAFRAWAELGAVMSGLEWRRRWRTEENRTGRCSPRRIVAAFAGVGTNVQKSRNQAAARSSVSSIACG
jgi:hypothetical protein